MTSAEIPLDGLTSAEDDELRRLHYFNELGFLAAGKLERLIELRLRDRRATIRPPWEFLEEERQEAEERVGREVMWRIRR